MCTGTHWTQLDAALLRTWPMPEVPPDADKEVRGRVLVVAGSREIPGAALLAATAAMRGGAGKLVIATAKSVAPALALAMPEARVIALAETEEGGFAMDGLRLLEECASNADAALIGPGLMDEAGTSSFVRALLPMLAHAPVMLDALAMNALREHRPLAQPVLLTPHAGEMAHLSGWTKESIQADPHSAVLAAVSEFNAVVALKGATTLLAAPGGERWQHQCGHPGLATSGSGDMLAGLIAGLAARQATLTQAAAWGIVLHALAGGRLAQRLGPLGYLASELAGEVPALMEELREVPA